MSRNGPETFLQAAVQFLMSSARRRDGRLMHETSRGAVPPDQ